ncbi:hypothetical protein QTP88_012816 [Uroleucon formosanum]
MTDFERLTNLYKENRKVHNLIRIVMAIALLPNQKLIEGFDEVRRMYLTEIQNYIGSSENENISQFLEYYSRTWLTGIFVEILSVSRQNRRTNNVLEISHRNLMKNLITYVHGIMNDYRLAVDGIEVRQPRARASIEQDKKITLGLTKLKQNRFTVAEFLGYTKHVTPNFGVQRPNVHNEELLAHPIEPIINIEPDLNIIIDNIEPRNRMIIGHESPPTFFQGVLRHYNLPLLVPMPIYAEQDAMPDDIWHQFQEHNLDNEIVPYVVGNIEPLVWPTFEFEPQQEVINPINDFPHINISRLKNMREIVVCVACMSTGSNIVLRSCNHVCLCGECFEGLDRLVCPLCQAVITEIVVILD